MPDGNSQDLISGGHLVAKALKAEGVEVIYTLCGGHIIDIYDGCVDEGIEVVDVRHEQVAAHAADGYARITGKPGCAVVTAGPGTTDAVTGVANAFRAESPMLLIGGQGAHTQHKMGSLQDLPHVDMMTPITKFAATVPDTARAADMVSMAFRECYHGAPGPSFLEIPRDVLDAKVPVEKARVPKAGAYRASTRSAGDPEAVEKLADLLVHAEKPAILLGSQVWTTRGTASAIELVRTLNIPAYMNGAGRGTLPPGDPHHFQLSRRYAFSNADVIVIVGTPFDFRMGYGKRLSPDATVVQAPGTTRARSCSPAPSRCSPGSWRSSCIRRGGPATGTSLPTPVRSVTKWPDALRVRQQAAAPWSRTTGRPPAAVGSPASVSTSPAASAGARSSGGRT